MRRKKSCKNFQGTSLTTKHLIFGILNKELNSTSVIRDSPCHPEESTCTWANSFLSGQRARPAVLRCCFVLSPPISLAGHRPRTLPTTLALHERTRAVMAVTAGNLLPRHQQWSPPMLGTPPSGVGG